MMARLAAGGCWTYMYLFIYIVGKKWNSQQHFFLLIEFLSQLSAAVSAIILVILVCMLCGANARKDSKQDRIFNISLGVLQEHRWCEVH